MTTRDGNLLGAHGTSFLNLAHGDYIAFDSQAQAFLNRPVVRTITIDPTTEAVQLDWANGDVFYLQGIAQESSIGLMLGTPLAGQSLSLFLSDNTETQDLTWNTDTGGFRPFAGITLPTATVAGRTYYFWMIYNAQDDYWDVIDTATLGGAE